MTPEEFSELPPEEKAKFREVLAKESNAELEQYFGQKLPQITAAIKNALAEKNEEQKEAELRRIDAGVGAYEAKLSQWNDACGERASAKLIAIVEHLGQTRNDIKAAFRGELPGQTDEGDEWKIDPEDPESQK